MTLDVIDLPGSAGARGQALGIARRAHIGSYLSAWLDSLRAAGIADTNSYISAFLRETNFLGAIQQHTPDLLQEVESVASAAELSFDLLLASQFLDEEWAYRSIVQSRTESVPKCSSVAIRTENGMTWLGQNMDLGSFTDGHQVMLRLGPSSEELGALVFTVGGMIGLLGVNSRGVGVCVNALPQLPSASEGLPVAFVVRRLLQEGSVNAAARQIQELPHATGQHYLLADPTSIRSFEASPSGVVEYRPQEEVTRVLHTNHPLVAASEIAASNRLLTNSTARLRALQGRLMTAAAPSLETIQAALSSCDDPDHPVCRVVSAEASADPTAGLINITTGSMISALRQDARRIHAWVSKGPPNLRGYAEFSLSTG